MIVQFSTKNDPTNHIEVEVSVFSVDSTKTRLYLKSEFLQIQEGVFVQFDDGVAGLELIILNENLESFHVDGVVGHEALAAGFVARGVDELDGDRPHRHGVADAVDALDGGLEASFQRAESSADVETVAAKHCGELELDR